VSELAMVHTAVTAFFGLAHTGGREEAFSVD